jgi:hypothetical protein
MVAGKAKSKFKSKKSKNGWEFLPVAKITNMYFKF